MNEEKLIAILRLQATKNIGDVLAKKLITMIGSPEQIFRESSKSLIRIPGIGIHLIRELLDKKYLKKAEEEVKRMQVYNYSYFLDEDYPKNLRQCVDAPILIFKDGKIDFDNERIISVVGTRNITTYGKKFCEGLICDLAKYNPIIVSGFAYGVDICAHKAALKNNLQTVGVLAHGLALMYPKLHKKYVQQVNQQGGFITEFWTNEPPIRENFLRRNRIVAGISQATIVIESAKKGGSLITAEMANSYHRDVFALGGRAGDTYSEGCNNLIKTHGAHLLTNAEDVATMLGWDVQKVRSEKRKEPTVSLSVTEQKVYNYLNEHGKQLIDVIAFECKIPIQDMAAILIEMELKSVVKSLPGKLFDV